MTRLEVLGYLNAMLEYEAGYLCSVPGHPWYGAYIHPDSGLADPSHVASSRYVFAGGLLILGHLQDAAKSPPVNPAPINPAPINPAPINPAPINTAQLYQEICDAAAFVIKSQRDSGLVDLHSTNYDSSPDTAFIMQQFAALLELTKGEPYFRDLNERLETFLRTALASTRDGGFHTPNHRWVISSALAQCKRLFPELEVQKVLDLYVDEGFDADDDGAYLERSSGVYDTVANVSLLLYALNTNREDKKQEALAAVKRNLEFNRYLHHADGTSEANLSRRQDYGIRRLALNLVAAYVFAHSVLDEIIFLETADWLWQKRTEAIPESLPWLAYVILKFGEPKPVNAQPPADSLRYFPSNKLWRVKHGKLSLSAYGGQTHLLNAVYGRAELSSLKIAQTYFSVGMFLAESLIVSGNSLTLHSSGKQKPRLPGYDLPTGQRVNAHDWFETSAKRSYRELPPAESQLESRLEGDTLHAHYKTLAGLDKVAAQISLDFPAGGLWESEAMLFRPASGQTLLHKRGVARMTYGHDVIELSHGHYQQGYLAMRNSELQGATQVRILMTFLTPVDFSFSLKFYRNLYGTDANSYFNEAKL